MNELTKVMRFEGNDVNIISINDTLYFELFSVGKALGYTVVGKNKNNPLPNKSRILKTMQNAEITGCLHGVNTYLSESELYDFMFEAHTRRCKDFKKWLSTSVLPQIRQTGGYIPVVEDEPNEVFLARAVQVANETIQHKDEIIQMQNKRISSLEVTEKDWKLLMDASGTFCINEIAHFIGIGEYRLFSLLRGFKVLFKNDNSDNVPYENQQNKKYFTTVAAVAPDGSVHSQTRVYPEGIAYITKILRKHKVLEVSA